MITVPRNRAKPPTYSASDHVAFLVSLDDDALRPPEDTFAGCREVVVIGDLQGNLPALVQLLLNERAIKFVGNNEVEWIADNGTYFVQMGNQIDPDDDDDGKQQHYDLETLFFADYLQRLSSGSGDRCPSARR